MEEISLIIEQKAKGVENRDGWGGGAFKRLGNSLKVLTSKMIFRMRKQAKQIRSGEFLDVKK